MVTEILSFRQKPLLLYIKLAASPLASRGFAPRDDNKKIQKKIRRTKEIFYKRNFLQKKSSTKEFFYKRIFLQKNSSTKEEFDKRILLKKKKKKRGGSFFFFGGGGGV